ncbi:trehalose-phosphatase [Dongia deserti]|uniref:trehalose-phosphatase n=1 Tax=Dongia deserti TaxID=2268030 RepID=UPI0013C4B698|nr:trehalose-phosphatase [Dongia deserti]
MQLDETPVASLGDRSSLALFLDIDGTLVPIAPTPAEVRPSPELSGLLTRAATHLADALAIVSGREITSIDQVTHGVVPYAAGSHGAEFRLGLGQPVLRPGPQPDIAGLETDVLECMKDWAGLLIEPKRAGLAVHYRKAPHLGPRVRDELEALLARRGQRDLALLQGDHVVEVRSPAHNKGEAVRRIMHEAVFHGKRPVFIGDDVTDEDGFLVVQELGGTAIIVGERRPTVATHKLASVAAVLDLLSKL